MFFLRQIQFLYPGGGGPEVAAPSALFLCKRDLIQVFLEVVQG